MVCFGINVIADPLNFELHNRETMSMMSFTLETPPFLIRFPGIQRGMHSRFCVRIHARLRVAGRIRVHALASLCHSINRGRSHGSHICTRCTCNSRVYARNTHAYASARGHICIRMSDWKYVLQGASAVCGSPYPQIGGRSGH